MATRRPSSPVPQWPLQDAKNRLSAVVEAAARGTPQVITRRGVRTAVVISYAEYERIAATRERPMPSLAAYLLAMPTNSGRRGEGEVPRIALAPRDVSL